MALSFLIFLANYALPPAGRQLHLVHLAKIVGTAAQKLRPLYLSFRAHALVETRSIARRSRRVMKHTSRRRIELPLAFLLAATATPCVGQPCHPSRSPSSELRIQRTLNAHPSRVFRAWLDPDFVTQWFSYHADVSWRDRPTRQIHVGGRFLWTVVSNQRENETFSFHGVYRELKPAKKLVFTWDWDSLPILGVADPGATVVTIELFPAGKRTITTLTQTGFTSGAARNAHEKGWNRCLDGIEFVLRTQQ
jgi:uncharacterized protein YndB with AHSA1/START domain